MQLHHHSSSNGSSGTSSNTDSPCPNCCNGSNGIGGITNGTNGCAIRSSSSNDMLFNDDDEEGGDGKYAKHQRRRRKTLQQAMTAFLGLTILFFVLLVKKQHRFDPGTRYQQQLVRRSHFLERRSNYRYQQQQLENEHYDKHHPNNNNNKNNNNNNNNAANGGATAIKTTEELSAADKIFQFQRKIQQRLQNFKEKAFNSDGEKNPLRVELENLDESIRLNRHVGIRWLRPNLLPPLPGSSAVDGAQQRRQAHDSQEGLFRRRRDRIRDMFRVRRAEQPPMAWEEEFQQIRDHLSGPKVDYTTHPYSYPDLMYSPPQKGGYPKLDTMGKLMERWPQDDVDHPPTPFVEVLLHFNYSNPKELAAATLFRDAELPFKLYGIPELDAARVKWTDQYISQNFDQPRAKDNMAPQAAGTCQESLDNFFAFFVPDRWDVAALGLPPARNSDWTFAKWAKHARYADHVGLDFDMPHFYFQAGVERQERYEPYSEWTFISRDLPSLSSPNQTFFVFRPEEQKGIQCRFGERGVTAATHYDSGRNMVAMITGAKRYVLSPPRACSRLGIAVDRVDALYRHSLLNFGRIPLLRNEKGDSEETRRGMSPEERAWLQRAGTAPSIDTVLKAGEILYIPSHWFHYITSLQKSAQCNVRSGVEQTGSQEFGGLDDVVQCNAP